MITLEWLADIGLRAAAVVVLAALFVRTVSRNPAALRHLAWTMALGSVLVVPVLTQVLPWRLPLMPVRGLQTPKPAADPRIPSSGLEGKDRLSQDGVSPSGLAEDHKPLTDPSETEGSLTDVVAPPNRLRMSFGAFAPLLWAGVAALLVLRLLVGFLLLGRVTREARELTSADWLELLDRACRRLDLRLVPRLLVSDRIAMPCTAGWRRPVILLPAGAEEWDPERRQVVLLHELAHVKRRDFLPHILAQAACAFQWFNPLVWIAAHRMRSDAERACDDLVLSAGARPSDYAAHLLEIVRASAPGRAPAPVLPMAQRSEFEGRLLAILEASGPRRLPSLRAAAVTAGFLFTAVIPIAAIGAAPPPPSVESPVEDAQDEKPFRPAQTRTEVRESAVLLMEALSDSNAGVRNAAAEALGSLDDTLAVRALIEVLRRDTDAGVRRSAAWALGEIEDPRAVPALSEVLRSDTDLEVRRNAAWALGSIEDPKATPALVEALRRERDLSMRKAIIEALSSIEDTASTEALTPFLKDPDPEIRKAAAEALSSIEDPRSVDDLMAAARDSDPDVRRAIIEALGSIEDRRAAPTIARALSDTDVEVRRAAADAISSLDELRQVPPELLQALSDSDYEVREKAIQALSSFEDPAAIGPLSALLKDEDVEIRRAALQALEDIDDPAVTRALREALKDTDPEVRRMAAKALGNRSR